MKGRREERNCPGKLITRLGADFVVPEYECCVRVEGGRRRAQDNWAGGRELYLLSMPSPQAVRSQAKWDVHTAKKRAPFRAYRKANHISRMNHLLGAQPSFSIPSSQQGPCYTHEHLFLPSESPLPPLTPSQHTPHTHLQCLGRKSIMTLGIKHPPESL